MEEEVYINPSVKIEEEDPGSSSISYDLLNDIKDEALEDLMVNTNDVDPLELPIVEVQNVISDPMKLLVKSEKQNSHKQQMSEHRRSARLTQKKLDINQTQVFAKQSTLKATKTKNNAKKQNKYNICTQCGKVFKGAYDLKKHMKAHPSFECNMCDYGSTNIDEAYKHVTTHKKSIDLNFIKNKIFKRKLESNKPAFGCVTCEYKQSNGESDFKCNLCQMTSSHQLKKPLNRSEQHAKTEMITEEVSELDLQARVEQENKLTTKTDKQMAEMEQNIKNTLIGVKESAAFEVPVWIEGNVNNCNRCESTFRKKDTFIRHWWYHNMRIFTKQQYPFYKNVMFQCKMCNAKFADHNFNMHINVHNVFQKYECNQCGYNTVFEASMDRHLKSHASTMLVE